MSECVVRMEFPLNCLECPMYDWNRQKLCCNAHHDLRPIPNGGVPKPDWCPIICSLPEGHGRLVSEKDVRWVIDDIVLEIAERIGHVPMTKNETMEYVNQLPTIVPAERSET